MDSSGHFELRHRLFFWENLRGFFHHMKPTSLSCIACEFLPIFIVPGHVCKTDIPFGKKAILWKKLWCPWMQNSTFALLLSEKIKMQRKILGTKKLLHFLCVHNRFLRLLAKKYLWRKTDKLFAHFLHFHINFPCNKWWLVLLFTSLGVELSCRTLGNQSQTRLFSF